MKMILKVLICISLYTILIYSCKKDSDEDIILSEADNIIALYSVKTNFDCSLTEDAISYPNPWTKEAANTFIVTEDELNITSTCGLVQTFFNQPWNILGPWCSTCSDLSINGMKYFNDRINQDVVSLELFSREDVLNKLTGKYISTIHNLKSLESHPGYLYSFEILLASDNINKILTDKVSKELMTLAMKMIDIKKGNVEFNNENSLAITRHIIVNILFQKQYEPFLSANLINGSLETFISGYKVCYDDNKVENYARMYLTNQN